jgi:uroporphyrinogen-III synthase
MTNLVVITRPRDEAEQLAAALQALGYSTLIEPMLRITALPAAIPDLGAYDALAFTSANGVRAFAAKSDERALPVFAVGVRTAEALAATGFSDIRTAEGDAEALARSIRKAPAAVSHVLHISGAAVARDLATLLRQTGRSIERLPLYDAIPADGLSQDLAAALYACTMGHVLFYSPRTAATFGTLVSKHGLADMIRSFTAICLSSQVAAKATGLPWAGIAVAARPTSDSLLSLLPPVGNRHG